MNKQGLLFKDSPEHRYELYCDYDKCKIIFHNVVQLRKHLSQVHKIHWCIRELPIRPLRRFHITQKQLDNLKNKKCWCGNSKKDFARKKKWYNSKFCSDKHYKDWWLRCDNTAFHRHKFMRQALRICEICGEKGIDTPFRSGLEMDHIIAIVLGGHPWNYDNLQMLCTECHKLKTKSDIAILAAWRQMQKYDLGPVIADTQLILEKFV